MEKYLCTSKFCTKSGFVFYEGMVYEVGGMYHHFREVKHPNGLRCYVENVSFKECFVECDNELIVVNNLFNSIMDGI